MLSQSEINQFNKDGAVLLKGKFEKQWIEKLKNGINEDINNPSPRFVRHTKDKDGPGYFEDFWTWDLYKDFKDFVFNSPTAQIASELLKANKINLVMDNWFYREAGLNQVLLFIMTSHTLILKELCVFSGSLSILSPKRMG